MRTWQAHKGGVMALAFSPDGRALVTAGRKENRLAVWDALGGGRLRSITPPAGAPLGAAFCLAYSADSRHLAVGYWAAVAVAEWGEGGAAWANPAPLPGGAGALAFAPDSATLAVAHNNKVTLWDFATGAVVELVGHKRVVWGVGFSPDGGQVHTVSSDGTARSFDAATAGARPGGGALYAAAFTPDGLMGAAGSADGRAVVFDLGE